jgi:hypothetical protein
MCKTLLNTILYAKNKESIFSDKTKTQLSPLGIIKIKRRSNINPY